MENSSDLEILGKIILGIGLLPMLIVMLMITYSAGIGYFIGFIFLLILQCIGFIHQDYKKAKNKH